jgi:hypothetical protein
MKTFKDFITYAEQFKSSKSEEELAKKHNVSLKFIQSQLKAGTNIELEHTKDKKVAKTIASQHIDEIPNYYELLNKIEKKSQVKEGTLHHWFKGSKSKDGRPGWVQADGSPCANEPGETKTPKCFSSGRLAALKRKGKVGENIIRSAVRRKRKEDPNQQDKSSSSAPTMVKTFSKGKDSKHYIKAEPTLKEATKDIPGKGSGEKDSCYYKVKARFKVWPSAYGSAALVRCRKVGADNWGNKSKKVNEEYARLQETGNTYTILISWKGIYRSIQFFVPGFTRPSKSDITTEVHKIYPRAKVLSYMPATKDPTKPYFFFGGCK